MTAPIANWRKQDKQQLMVYFLLAPMMPLVQGGLWTSRAKEKQLQALALIDTTARYVIVLPLRDREASTFIRPFLDNLVFIHGPPETLHSDAAQEFLSEALRLLTESTGISTTTTLGHAANANGTIEVFWRF